MGVPTLKVELQKVTSSGYHDVTSYVQSWNTNRGRSRQLDRFEAGTFSINFNNRSRAFDPLYTSSPFYGAIVPRANLKITVGGYVAFSGQVNDWNFSYDVSGESVATASGTDLFGILAQQVFTIPTTIPGTTGSVWGYTGVSEPELGISWAGSVFGGSGYGTTITSQNIQGLGILEFWQTLERTERGYLFCNREGLLTFQGRNYSLNSGVVMDDQGLGIPYSGISVTYGTELLYNKAVMTRVGSTGTATAVNTTSAAAYGYSVYEDSGLLYVSDNDLADAAGSFVAEYGDPEYRFEEATFDLHGLSLAQQQSLLQLDMAQDVTVIYTPNGIGSAIQRILRVIGVSHSGDAATHSVTFRFEQIYDKWFILDSDTNGLLDSNVLGW